MLTSKSTIVKPHCGSGAQGHTPPAHTPVSGWTPSILRGQKAGDRHALGVPVTSWSHPGTLTLLRATSCHSPDSPLFQTCHNLSPGLHPPLLQDFLPLPRRKPSPLSAETQTSGVGNLRGLKLMRTKSLQLCPTLATPWTAAHQAPPSVGFSRQEYCSGLPCPPPGDLPHPGIESIRPLAPSHPAASPAGGLGTLPYPKSTELSLPTK